MKIKNRGIIVQMENFIPSEKYVHGTKLWTLYTAIIVGYTVSIMDINSPFILVTYYVKKSQTIHSQKKKWKKEGIPDNVTIH